jgi:hypothetical protein
MQYQVIEASDDDDPCLTFVPVGESTREVLMGYDGHRMFKRVRCDLHILIDGMLF